MTSLRSYLSAIAVFGEVYAKVYEDIALNSVLVACSNLTGWPSSLLTTPTFIFKELGVWSESLPSAQTCGLGPKAEAMLASYRHVASALEDLNRIRGLRDAFVMARPPLQVGPKG